MGIIDDRFRFKYTEITLARFFKMLFVLSILLIFISIITLFAPAFLSIAFVLIMTLIIYFSYRQYKRNKIIEFYQEYNAFIKGKRKINIYVSRWLDKVAVRVFGEVFVIEANPELLDYFVDEISKFIYDTLIRGVIPEEKSFPILNAYFTYIYGANDEIVAKILIKKVLNDYKFLIENGVLYYNAPLYDIITSLKDYWRNRKEMVFDDITLIAIIGLIDEFGDKFLEGDTKAGYELKGFRLPEIKEYKELLDNISNLISIV